MHSLSCHFLLLAERSRIDNLSDSFRGHASSVDKSEVVAGLLILAGITTVVWLLSRLLASQGERKPYRGPRRLFLSLCTAHELRWSDRWLLWRLAVARRLKDPARVFLEPQRFEEAGLPRSLRVRAVRLRQLRDGLFAQPVKKEPTDASHPSPQQTKDSANRQEIMASQQQTSPKQAAPAATPLLPLPPSPVLDVPPWDTVPAAPILPTN
jgi:hypothetical protein